MASAARFGAGVRRWSTTTKARSVEQLRFLGLQLASGIIQGSPVLTGRFRANWNVNVATANAATTEATDTSGAITIARASVALAGVSKLENIHITNGLPYAVPLEFGHSKQAPNGMVRVNIARLDGAKL